MNAIDPAPDIQSVAYQSDKIGYPDQDPTLDDYVEGSSKPINFSALKDQHIEYTKQFFLSLKKDSERRKRANIKMVDFDHFKFKSRRFYFDCFIAVSYTHLTLPTNREV